jgi:multiple sugar transport system permease protein
MGAMRKQEVVAGYLFILPAVIVLVTFMVVPILSSLILVFTDYGLLSAPNWIGKENLVRVINDKRMWTCYSNSLFIALGAVAGNNFLGLTLAMAINRPMHKILKYFYRTCLFFPVLTTTSSLAMVWRFILTRDRGIMNWIIGQFGLGPVSFIGDASWAIPSVIMYDVWKSSGYLMVLYLAGLQGIPESLYEAAKIDGASGWQVIRHITLPLITPTAFFSLVMSSIGAFQIFDNAYVLTEGGPGDASRTIAMYIYEMAFNRYEMGYAATVALSLLVLLVGLTALQLWGGRRWVHYD